MGRTGNRREQGPEDEVLRLVQEHAADLIRFARRFSFCADDAQDAYQRGIEILIRRMRTSPPDHPLNWLRTVIRNEAATVRTQREELVGREEVDLDRHEGRHLEDPADRAAGFERLRHTAEALQRLKPQEITALVLRAEGHSYREIAERKRWTYTKVNRCVTEGRRALLERLGAIESGAECERWLPLLSLLADGEATRGELADLRPHLRGCPACRATLRHFHGVPREVAALVPAALVPLAGDPGATAARHLETAIHALLERVTGAMLRMQGALDPLPGAKFAAVAASTAAIAGGGAAIERVAHVREQPRAALARPLAASAANGLIVAGALTPARTSASRPATALGGSAAKTTRATPAGEFDFEAAGGPAADRPSARGSASTPREPTARAAAVNFTPPPSSPRPTATSEFAGP